VTIAALVTAATVLAEEQPGGHDATEPAGP
jgi:hypothetical protein